MWHSCSCVYRAYTASTVASNATLLHSALGGVSVSRGRPQGSHAATDSPALPLCYTSSGLIAVMQLTACLHDRSAREQALLARSPLLCYLISYDHDNDLVCVQNKVSMSLMGTLASAVLGRAYQVYYSASLTKQRIQDDMTRRLYEKTVRRVVWCENCAGWFWLWHQVVSCWRPPGTQWLEAAWDA